MTVRGFDHLVESAKLFVACTPYPSTDLYSWHGRYEHGGSGSARRSKRRDHDDAVKRLQFIKHAQELGFSLKEIKELLSLRVRRGSSCADVRKKAETKIADVDEKIRHLQEIRAALVELTNTCSGRGPIDSCTILQSLNKASL